MTEIRNTFRCQTVCTIFFKNTLYTIWLTTTSTICCDRLCAIGCDKFYVPFDLTNTRYHFCNNNYVLFAVINSVYQLLWYIYAPFAVTNYVYYVLWQTIGTNCCTKFEVLLAVTKSIYHLLWQTTIYHLLWQMVCHLLWQILSIICWNVDVSFAVINPKYHSPW